MSLVVDIKKKLWDFQLCVKFESEDETLALLGASGCGKSMTLKCIAGVVRPDSGRIVLNGKTLFDSWAGVNLPPQERKTGLVFQNYALFPHMTVAQNILAGTMRAKDRALRQERAGRMMEQMGLISVAERYPGEISGGQQQRVALARVLVSEPDILLLDEPLSALDSYLRFRLEQDLRHIFREFGKPVILVSHDRDEVYRMADKIAVLQNGQIECIGDKEEVFCRPQTKTGAVLTGCKNISRADRIDGHHVYAGDWGMVLRVPEVPEGLKYAGFRMHDIVAGQGENCFCCRVVEVIENPFSVTVFLQTDGMEQGQTFGWEINKEAWHLDMGEKVMISVLPEKILLLTN